MTYATHGASARVRVDWVVRVHRLPRTGLRRHRLGPSRLDSKCEATRNRDWAEARQGRIVRSMEDGVPFLEIVRYAKEHEIDLIVLATHGRSALAQVLLGSVAERVVRKAPCPVLTVRPEGHQFVMP